MFIKNDYVVHKVYGVCVINTITTLESLSSSRDKLYYSLSPVYETESVVYVPVDNSKKLRALTTEAELLKTLDKIEETPTLWVSDERAREKSYKLALEKGEITDWLSIIKTIYDRKKQRDIKGKKLIGIDQKYIKIAENLLFGEIAVILKINKDDVKNFIIQKAEKINA